MVSTKPLKITVPLAIFILIASLLTPLSALVADENLPSTPVEALRPIKTDNPRDTMRSFMEAMDDYREGRMVGNRWQLDRINDAARTLDVPESNILSHDDFARESAIYLKEVIDRAIAIDYDLIPDDPTIDRWRLKDSEITIVRITAGDRRGEFLFSQDTVRRAGIFYQRVRHLPYIEGTGQGAVIHESVIEHYMPLWMRDEIAYLAYWQWLAMFISVLIGLTLRLFASFFLDMLQRLASRTPTEWDAQIVRAAAPPLGYLAAGLFWMMTLHLLRLEGTPLRIMTLVLKGYISFLLVWLVYRLADVATLFLRGKATQTNSHLDTMLVPLITRTLKIFVLIMGTLIVIQNLGVNVMSLLAGLGIGGLAIALAARDGVANFFGSLMILFDRPFKVGDWIKIGSSEGTVEEIGFRSTRIRTFYNSLVTLPNSLIANEQIDNMGMRRMRRVRTTLGLTYDTPPEKIEEFLGRLRTLIAEHPATDKSNNHIVFNDYGAYSLDIMVYFFLSVPDWRAELLQRENILLDFLRIAKEVGVEFAFPTETLHIESLPDGRLLDGPDSRSA